MANGLNTVSNYLVPATGSTNAYLVRETFSGTPFAVDFRKVELDGLAFRPYSVLIENTAGSDPVTVTIPEMSLNIVCPAGKTLQFMYPSPTDSSALITGNGLATVIFTDYPMVPYLF